MNDNTSNNNDGAPSEQQQQQQQQPQQQPRRIVRFRVPAGARIHLQSPRRAPILLPRPANDATTQQQQQQQQEEQEEYLRHVIGEGETTSPNRYDGAAFGLSELRRRRRWVRQQDRGADNTTINSNTTATHQLTRNTNAPQQQQQQHDNDVTAMLQDMFQHQQGQTLVNTTITANSNANNNFNNINSNNNNSNSNNNTLSGVAQDVLQHMLQQRQEQPQPQPVTLPPLQVRPLPDTKQVLRNSNDNHHGHIHHIHPEETTPTCCICCEYLSTDIQQCRHDICTARFCGTCLQKYLQQQQQQRRNASATTTTTTTTALVCPMCQQDTSPGFVADATLQDYTRHLSRPCRYAECPVVLPLAALTTHEATCPAQRVACRYATLGCPWQGTRATVMDHQEGKYHQNHEDQEQDHPPPPPPCPYHALAPWIEQQRTAAATMQRHVQILSRQLLERQQHAALLEHAMRRTQERLRVFETRLAQAQRPTQQPAAPEQQQQQQRTMTTATTATTIRNYTTHGYVHLTPLVQTWVRALSCPAVLLHDTHAVARTWASVPTRLAAVGTVVDMIHHHYVGLTTSGEDRSVSLPLPPLTLTIFLLLWVACREWNDQQFGPIVSIAWGMILYWFRHSDQCLTIWASTVVATTVGCELWGGRRHELRQQQRGLSSAMALAWVWVSCGMAHTLWVAVQWASAHVLAQALAKLFWPTQQDLFHLAICLPCFVYFWESRDVVLLWIFFWSMHRLVGFVAARLARRVRACPTKIAVWLCSTIVLLFLSWSIADCLYVPLESMLDWILLPGTDEQWQDGTDHATDSPIADPL